MVEKFEPPKNAKGVRQFLGLTGFFRRFIKDYAQIATPLNNLLKKETVFVWFEDCEKAFQTLKKKLVTSPILAFPNFKSPFELHTDASGTAIGSVLMQKQGDGTTRVIAYGGRSLLPRDRAYSVTELEALAVIDGVKHFAPYLHGRHFDLFTDHANLKYLLTAKDLKGRAMRWALTLQGHDFTIHHTPGRLNGHADALSRLQPSISSLETGQPNLKTIKEKQRADPDLAQLIGHLETREPYTHQGPAELAVDQAEEFLLEEGVLFKRHIPERPYHHDKLLVIPESLREEIMINCHDAPLAAHFGIEKTYHKVACRYWWPRLQASIRDYCNTCEPCQKRKRKYGSKKAPLVVIPIGSAF